MSPEPNDPTADSQRLRYAAGLPFSRARSLTEAERVWLRRKLGRVTGISLAVALGLVLSLVAASGLSSLRPDVATKLGGPVGIWLGAAGVTGSVVALLRGGWPRIPAALGTLYLLGLAAVGALVPELTERPHLFTKLVVVALIAVGTSVLLGAVARTLAILVGLRRVRRDVLRGVVECFEGIARSPSAELQILQRRGYGPPLPGAPMQLDVLPSSGLVLRAGARRCGPWIRAHLAQVAVGQPHALRVELPQGVAPTSAAERLTLQRRSLCPEERAELDRHIRRLRRRPWSAVAATTGLALAVWWQLRGASLGDGWTVAHRLVDPMMLGWYALALLTVVAYARRTIAARKLDDDRRLRWVVTVDGRHDDALATPTLEVLPVSQLAWTENATPASWRMSRL